MRVEYKKYPKNLEKPEKIDNWFVFRLHPDRSLQEIHEQKIKLDKEGNIEFNDNIITMRSCKSDSQKYLVFQPQEKSHKLVPKRCNHLISVSRKMLSWGGHCGSEFEKIKEENSTSYKEELTIKVMDCQDNEKFPIGRMLVDVPLTDFCKEKTFIREDNLSKKLRILSSGQTPQIVYSGDISTKQTIRRDDLNYYIGAQRSGCIYVYPCEHYVIGLTIDNETKLESLVTITKKDMDAKNELVDRFAAAKKKRKLADMKAKNIDESQILEVTEIKEKIQRDGVSMDEVRAEYVNVHVENCKSYLPWWKDEVAKRSDIFGEGLEAVFPEHLIKNIIVDDDTCKWVFKKSPKTDSEMLDMFTTNASVQFIKQRHLSSKIIKDMDEAKFLVQKAFLINKLISIMKDNRFTRMSTTSSIFSKLKKQFDEKLPIQLVKVLSTSFFPKSTLNMAVLNYNGESKTSESCVLNKQKLLCHLILYIIQNSPNYQFDSATLIKDLNFEADQMRNYFQYCGCEMNFYPGTIATLKEIFTPPIQSLSDTIKDKQKERSQRFQDKKKAGGSGKGKGKRGGKK